MALRGTHVRAWALALAVASLLPWSAPARAGGADGWAAYSARRYADAVQLWTAEAEAGDPEAQFGLGIVYDLGQGVAPDSLRACEWYRRAGSVGHVVAAFNTGVMYDSGRCGARRADLAALWYARAGAFGHPRAQFNIAQLYAAGDGVPRNIDAAAAWFRLAEANGIPAAAGRSMAISRNGSNGVPVAVVPAPTADMRPAMGGDAVLVWVAPPEPARARFFLEVNAIHAEDTQEVFSAYVDSTAFRVKLPPGERRFAWRVLTTTAEPARYSATAWERLDTQP